MNKKAQSRTLALGIITGIFLFIVGMVFMNFIKDEVTRTRNSDNLNCSDSSISDGSKLTCLTVDWVVPYFIITIFAFSGGMFVTRLLGGKP